MRANATVLTRGVKRIMVIRLRLQEAKDKFMVYLANGRQIDANLAVFSSLLSKRYLMAKSEGGNGCVMASSSTLQLICFSKWLSLKRDYISLNELIFWTYLTILIKTNPRHLRSKTALQY
jgi:hypothetical protein